MPRSLRERLFMLLLGSFLLVYILWPLAGLFLRADWEIVAETSRDQEVLGALWRSIWTAAALWFCSSPRSITATRGSMNGP